MLLLIQSPLGLIVGLLELLYFLKGFLEFNLFDGEEFFLTSDLDLLLLQLQLQQSQVVVQRAFLLADGRQL